MVAVAFLPPVQTWAARTAVAAVAGPGASIESASFGPAHVSLRGLRVEMDGAVLSAAHRSTPGSPSSRRSSGDATT